MTSPYALLRLWLRPYTLLAAALALLASTIPFLIATNHVDLPLGPLWRGTAEGALFTALWQFLAFGPFAFGWVSAAYRLEVQHLLPSWYLPDLRRGMLTGTMLIGVMLAGSLALLVARNTAGLAWFAAFGLALFCFLAPGVVFDVAAPRYAAALGLLGAALVALRPGLIAEVGQAQPLLIGAVALALAVPLCLPIIDAGAARARPFRWSNYVRAGSKQALWVKRGGRAKEPLPALTTARVWPWVGAAVHEHRHRFPLAHLKAAVIAAVLLRLFDNPGFLPLFAGAHLTETPLQLRTGMWYPLPRHTRAWVALAGTWLDLIVWFALVLAVLAVLSPVPTPVLPIGNATPSALDWLLAIGCSFALAPIAQWAFFRRPTDGTGQATGTAQLAQFGRLLVYLFAVSGVSLAIANSEHVQGDVARAAIGVLLVTLVVQSVHAVRVYRWFTRRDLEPKTSQ